ncbi:MAG: ABC transporter permease subunit [Wujia sp.]
MEESNTTVSEASSEAVMAHYKSKVKEKEVAAPLYIVQRIVALFAVFAIFIPAANPEKVSALIGKNLSLFTSAVSYSSLKSDATRLLRMGHLDESAFVAIYISAILMTLGVIAIAAATCCTLGNNKFKRLASYISLGGSVLGIIGMVLTYVGYGTFAESKKTDSVVASFDNMGIKMYIVVFAIMLIFSIIEFFIVPKVAKEEKYEMETKFKLLILFLPFALLAFVFSYLPLWGWRYAFFDYRAGDTLSMDKFVGLKWFTYLFENEATKKKLGEVLINTLAMSGLGIITSWVPLAFAVLLTEISNMKFRRVVQTLTTIPNFISWIIVYTIAFAIFSSDGFINTFGNSIGLISGSTNYLMSDSHTWLKMLAWGLWKGVGWSAIIYIAGISGIDRQLYEAATVDGASRFQRIWHVTLPGLIPTYMVMLLMAVAGMLSNGLDQYLVFENAINTDHMQVLDLYVYKLGIGDGGNIPLSTVIGMAKSLISVVLLFMANGVSKLLRGESIV